MENEDEFAAKVEALGGFRKVSIAVKFAEEIGTSPPASAAEVELLYQMFVGLTGEGEKEQGGLDE